MAADALNLAAAMLTFSWSHTSSRTPTPGWRPSRGWLADHSAQHHHCWCSPCSRAKEDESFALHFERAYGVQALALQFINIADPPAMKLVTQATT
ncbi:MAG: hypothetical protein R2844_16110 [Caldilineales bacterium]